jgi:uncharacterized protein (TIGR02453 family)
MTFTGFPDEARSFFRQLSKHQTREWFHANKQRYQEQWEAPMTALLADVAAKIDEAYPYAEVEPPKVFRIYRDVRFAKDKAPYKTNISGVISVQGTGGAMTNPAALYIQLGIAADSFAAAGHYQMPAEKLARFRAAVVDSTRGKELAKILSALEKRGFEIDAYESLKKVPRGFDATHPLAPILKMKGLVAKFPALPSVGSADLAKWLVKHCKAVEPLVTWTTYA